MIDHFVAWWNLENLFDIQGSLHRSPWLAKHLARELDGWTPDVLERKIIQLARVIRRMNDRQGPDLLGICEVENRQVIERLLEALAPLGRTYAVAHHDSADKRGLDTAIIYDPKRFEADERFTRRIQKRSGTRDLFQVNLKTTAGNNLVVVANHWPSRRGGVYDSEPFRIMAGETLAYWNQRIREIKGRDVPILVMGDFNDEPHSRSLTHYALSTQLAQRVQKAASTPRLLNLMWNEIVASVGTYAYGSTLYMFDQFLVSAGLLNPNSAIRALVSSVRVINDPMLARGLYRLPRRYNRPSRGKVDTEGFSDHFPISMKLSETQHKVT
jgi:endonuclease/exonuclease/phosphatase family metal-dependent hydrolase